MHIILWEMNRIKGEVKCSSVKQHILCPATTGNGIAYLRSLFFRVGKKKKDARK